MYDSVERKNGQFNLFLWILVGISLEPVQILLIGLLPQTEDSSETVEEIKTYLNEMDLKDVSPERSLNLFLRLTEVKDDSLHEDILKCLRSEDQTETGLSHAHCSALANVLLTSDKVLDEFYLIRYKTSRKGIF
ncbi:unnamed protein product [Oncorhynchus mykiss]|uniref:NACHT LRR and PYD domain-containing protein n=1 Tax=Oncorhynchus mykiss TaxID=8022 RepID=A0A060Z9I5_ONCMY|nr:unnamed protein product [Oncorhynchus mykiss]